MNFRNSVGGIIALLGIIYFLYFIINAEHQLSVMLWILGMILILYIPCVLISENLPRIQSSYVVNKKIKNNEKIEFQEEFAHFRKVMQKALQGNSVAQREIEIRILEMVSTELMLRYEFSEKEIMSKMRDEKFLSEQFGDAGKIVAEMFERRHNLTLVIPPDKFRREIEKIMEAMK